MKYGRQSFLILAALMAASGPAAGSGRSGSPGGSGSSAIHARHLSQNQAEKREAQPGTGSDQDRQRHPAERLPVGDQSRLRDLEDELAREQQKARHKLADPQEKEGR